MTYKYKNWVDLDEMDNPSKQRYFSHSLLSYARELEDRVARMQEAGNVLTQISGVLGLCWASEITPSMKQVQDTIS